MVLQDPFSAFNPVFRDLARGDAQPRAAQAGARAAPSASSEAERVCETVGLSPKMLTTIPVRDERRRAPADRLRAGPGGAAEADPRRRAGLDARRVDPRRRPQHDGGPARPGGRLAALHHPRPRQRPLRRRPHHRDVRGPSRRGGPDRDRPRRVPSIRIRSCCCRRRRIRARRTRRSPPTPASRRG